MPTKRGKGGNGGKRIRGDTRIHARYQIGYTPASGTNDSLYFDYRAAFDEGKSKMLIHTENDPFTCMGWASGKFEIRADSPIGNENPPTCNLRSRPLFLNECQGGRWADGQGAGQVDRQIYTTITFL